MKSGYTEGKPIQSSYSWLGGMAWFGLTLIFGSWVIGTILTYLGIMP